MRTELDLQSHLQVYGEATLVGLMVLICGAAISSLFMLLPRPSDPKKWNAYHYMELSLFLTGVAIHLGCEVTGLNRYYCRHGSACSD